MDGFIELNGVDANRVFKGELDDKAGFVTKQVGPCRVLIRAREAGLIF